MSPVLGSLRRAVKARLEAVDWPSIVLLVLALTGMVLVMRQPPGLVTSVSLGGPFVPFSDGGSIWWSPIGVVTMVLAVLLLARLLTARRPLVDLRGWWASAREADLVGALLLSVALAGVILAFATADPQVQVFSDAGPWWLAMAAVGGVLFALHNRRSAAPLVPRGAFAEVAAWGSLVVSFLVGAALIAALVDIPIFARLTVADGSQVRAALVLLEFLVALPVGALVGGVLTRRAPAGSVAAVGMLLAAIGFWMMADWGIDSLHHLASSVVLAVSGFGFGLAIAPVNAALLASTGAAVHGVTSALLVVARMVGHARRHLGAHHDRAAPLLLRPGRHPLARPGVHRREDPVPGVRAAAGAGRHRAAAGDLPRCGSLRRARRGPGRALLPPRADPGDHPPQRARRHRIVCCRA